MTDTRDWATEGADALTAALTEDNLSCSCLRCHRYRSIAAAALREVEERDREKIAQWMIARSYATGHGDSIEDLLAELDAHLLEARLAEHKAIEARLRRPDEALVEALAIAHSAHTTAQYGFSSLYDEYTADGKAAALGDVRASLVALADALFPPKGGQ